MAEKASFDQAIRDAAMRKALLDIGRCDDETTSEEIVAILGRIDAGKFDDIDTQRLLKTLAAQTGDNYLTLRRRFNEERRARYQATSAASAEEAKLIDELNEQFSVVNDAGKVWVMRRRKDPVMNRDTLERIAFADFKKMYGNRTVSGQKVAELWLTHADRHQYIEGVTFDPSDNAPEGWLNLWRGFSVEPIAGDWSLMREHLLKVICCGDSSYYEYLLNWAALAVQHPEKQAEVAVVLRGGKGTGKGTFGRWLCALFGQHGMQVSNSAHLVGKFNLHLRDCVLLFADEAFYAGDKQNEGVLKSIITEPHLVIEGKGQNVVITQNMLHVIMASNSDWVVPASVDERRYFALDVADTKARDLPYFKKIETQMQAAGAAAMLHSLLTRDISDFEVRRVPQTAALRGQKTLSLASLPSWWLAVLERGYLYNSRHDTPWFAEWHDFYSTQMLCRSYWQWCEQGRRYTRSSEVELGRFMAKVAWPKRPREQHPVAEIDSPDREMLKAGGSLHKHGIIWRDRPPGYEVGSVGDAREQFLKAYGGIDAEWTTHDGAD